MGEYGYLKMGFGALILVALLVVGCGADDMAVDEVVTVTVEVATAEPVAVGTVPVVDVDEGDAAVEMPAFPPNLRAGNEPYWDANLPIETRVEDLLERMTLDEKMGQMTLIETGSIRPDGVTEFMLGGILSGGGGGPAGDNSALGWLNMVNGYQMGALETRLGIPLIYGVDAVHGHSNVTGATIFPHNIGLGAAGNADLMVEIGRATAIETIATGIYWDYAPVFAVVRDVRWGRTYEAYGEQPDLVGELGTAYLLGLQSVDGEHSDLGDERTLLATAKHWVGDGGTTWGSSTTGNYMIDQGDTIVDEAFLREVHIAPYLPALDAGAMSVMTSYSSWNGLKMHGHDYLVNEVLKGELGFAGFIVSDWAGVDQVDDDYYDAVVASVNAGIDMNMVPFDAQNFIRTLRRAITNGDIPMSRIDDAVRRILRVKFELGLFERPLMDDSLLDSVGSAEHRAIARQAVRESLVLLKNENEALPIDKEVGRIFVAGQHADDLGLQSGGWTIEWQGGSGDITDGTTILDGITSAVGTDTEIVYDRFGKFERVEGNADIGIVVLGERPYAEGQGDRADLDVNPLMIERVAERADTVILILVTGRPLVITEAMKFADAVVVAWLPGTEGNGVSDVLFGDFDFTGKLSFSWMRTMEQLPFDFAEMADSGCDAPLFPYGYGLTMAEFVPVVVPVCEDD